MQKYKMNNSVCRHTLLELIHYAETREVASTPHSMEQLALSLLVLRVFTDNSDASLSLNDFAFFTNWFN